MKWKERLEHLEKNDNADIQLEAEQDAANWGVCAVGEALDLKKLSMYEIDRKFQNHPHGAKLISLGDQFSQCVFDEDFESAKNTLDQFYDIA